MKTRTTFSQLFAPVTVSLLLVLGMAIPAASQTVYVTNDQVGIGVETPDPGSKLHIQAESVGAVDAILLKNATGPARLNLQNLSETNTATTDQKWTINSNGTLRFTAGDDSAEMLLDAAGNLTVQSSIQVNGVQLDVPDYVFDEDYELMPMSDLKTFIEENQHLPEIPSASEVEQKGLDMTAMQMRLLQKIEELTLYTLQQQEVIEELTSKVEALSQK